MPWVNVHVHNGASSASQRWQPYPAPQAVGQPWRGVACGWLANALSPLLKMILDREAPSGSLSVPRGCDDYDPVSYGRQTLEAKSFLTKTLAPCFTPTMHCWVSDNAIHERGSHCCYIHYLFKRDRSIFAATVRTGGCSRLRQASPGVGKRTMVKGENVSLVFWALDFGPSWSWRAGVSCSCSSAASCSGVSVCG